MATRERASHPPVRELAAGPRPRVTVVITCYNYGHWLEQCVRSALEQPGVDVDVIVVDDASKDDSVAVARRIARADARVRVVVHAANRGHVASINEGFAMAEGRYLVKLDADDILAPGSLARSVALLEQRPSVGFVYGRPLHFGRHLARSLPRSHRWLRRYAIRAVDDPRQTRVDTRVRGWTVWPGAAWLQRMCERGTNCISSPEVVMRAETVRSVGPFDERLAHTHDLAMWLALAAVSDVGHVDGAIQGFYRVHDRSLQRTVHAGRLLDLQGRLAAFSAVLGAAPPQQRGRAAMMATVRRRLAQEALDEACRAYDRGRVRDLPVEGYASFALDACTEARALPQWRRLGWRRSVGERWSPYFLPFFVGALLRRANEEVAAARWWRFGL